MCDRRPMRTCSGYRNISIRSLECKLRKRRGGRGQMGLVGLVGLVGLASVWEGHAVFRSTSATHTTTC